MRPSSADMGDPLLVEAAGRHLHGDLAGAEAIYARLLEAQPDHTDALYLLGTLELQLHKVEQAISQLKRLTALDPTHLQGQLHLAAAYRESGLLQEAMDCYQTALAADPRLIQAYLGLGELHTERGEIGEALNCWGKAAELEPQAAIDALEVAREVWPGNAQLECQLGQAYFLAGRYMDAVHAFEHATAHGEKSAECWFRLAACYRQLDLYREAETACRRALEQDPRHVEALHLAGQLMRAAGHVEAAVGFFQQVLQVKPDYAMAHFHLGNALFALGRLAPAEAALRRTVELAPSYAPARNNLGVVLKAAGRLAEASDQLHEAVHIDPGYGEAYNNLGNVLAALDQPEAAEPAYRRALSLDRTNAQAYNNLGITLQAMGAVDAALQSFDTAIMVRPKFAMAHWNRAIALLLRGDYEEGFREYDWGFAAGTRLHLDLGQQVWRGSAEPGRTLLVYAEQGFGDTLHFARYLRHARALFGRLILVCQPELVRLLQGVAGADEVLSETAPLPAFDFYCSLLSLPGIMGLGLVSGEGCLPPAPPMRPELAQALAGEEFKVGLVWAGQAAHQNDQRRSCPFEQLAPLLGIPGPRFFSLQKGEAVDDPRLTDLAPWLDDFADTAAAIQALDLVITVDTAVAHLAGGLGRPVWLMLPFAPDWRWGLEKGGSPWYPGMRLFRQARPGAWGGIVNRMIKSINYI